MPSDPTPTRSGRTRRITMVDACPPHGHGSSAFAGGLVAALERGQTITSVASSFDAATVLPDDSDVVIVQHAFAADAGDDPTRGDLVDALRRLGAPTIVIAHSVPTHPTGAQRAAIGSLARVAEALVVMTSAARDRLVDAYALDAERIHVIARGAHVPPPSGNGVPPGRPRLLTWGMLRPGKGIEHAIRAIALLDEPQRDVRYLIAGPNHPSVSGDGDEYRNFLIRTAFAAGVAGSVRFDGIRRGRPALIELVTSASVVILPYDPSDEVTSSVLVDTVAAGRPVIATAFPQAVELLGDSAGMVVPHGDAVALAGAIGSLLDDPSRIADMAAAARRLAPTLTWDSVATRYAALCDRLTPAGVG